MFGSGLSPVPLLNSDPPTSTCPQLGVLFVLNSTCQLEFCCPYTSGYRPFLEPGCTATTSYKDTDSHLPAARSPPQLLS